jgi:hypothetical protein
MRGNNDKRVQSRTDIMTGVAPPDEARLLRKERCRLCCFDTIIEDSIKFDANIFGIEFSFWRNCTSVRDRHVLTCTFVGDFFGFGRAKATHRWYFAIIFYVKSDGK